jgi:hypothetical protein
MPECIMMAQTVLVQRMAFRFEIAGVLGRCGCCRRAGPGCEPCKPNLKGHCCTAHAKYVFLNKFPGNRHPRNRFVCYAANLRQALKNGAAPTVVVYKIVQSFINIHMFQKVSTSLYKIVQDCTKVYNVYNIVKILYERL